MKTMKGNPITVSGTVLKVGDQALDFTVTGNDLKDVKLSDFKKPYVLLNVVPSLDTSVCDIQTRKINESLAGFEQVDVLTISNDLPFAQKRWCGAAGLSITTLSDYKNLDFAKKYGVLIEEMRLLARSVFVLDKDRKVIYVEYLDEMSKHPDYYKLLDFMNSL
ncbi:thiol peroxidase [Acholeplasma hippikon]|uniref:Thiol peroxidase n=1 Tax=Acholeplasma hippikon TaxID=264636 RepID=A0A449BJN7_9MOLU|nr:thiol peroxidase [Acholeplasma hippikon]VEU82648.1 thiol peroxidase [Acholeplasma hippikon]